MSRRVLMTICVTVALVGLYLASLVLRDRANDLRAHIKDFDVHANVPDPRLAKALVFRFNELAADLAWVRTLVYYGDGLANKTGMPDVEKLLALVNALDPRFRRPYLWGAYATIFRNLQATQAEYEASAAILRRGLAEFPDSWELAWHLGNRLFWDLKPPGDARRKLREEGALLIERAMHLPDAPKDLPKTAATMRTVLGQKDRALKDLREMILITDDEPARKVLLARYQELSEQKGEDVLVEARRFEADWRKHMFYVPPNFYILVGPPLASGIDLKDTLNRDVFTFEER